MAIRSPVRSPVRSYSPAKGAYTDAVTPAKGALERYKPKIKTEEGEIDKALVVANAHMNDTSLKIHEK